MAGIDGGGTAEKSCFFGDEQLDTVEPPTFGRCVQGRHSAFCLRVYFTAVLQNEMSGFGVASNASPMKWGPTSFVRFIYIRTLAKQKSSTFYMVCSNSTVERCPICSPFRVDIDFPRI